MNQRAYVGGDGSDQMGMVLTLGLLTISGGQLLADQDIARAGILLIGGQAVLAYFIAGASKIVSRPWRNGTAISGVMKTQTYGHAGAVNFIQSNPGAAKLICWTVIITECLFPVVLLLPLPMLLAALTGFAIFHLVNAYFMGLNAFVLPFIATYPSVILLNDVVRQGISVQLS
jgi:hypothetical protein